MATITATASGGTRAWFDAATWDVGVPTAADDVKLNATSGNVTILANSNPVCRSLDCTGYTNVLQWVGTTTNTTLSIGDATAGAGNIALKFSSTMSLPGFVYSRVYFISTSAVQQTITTSGKQVAWIYIDGSGSSYVLGDSLTQSSSTHDLEIYRGTLATGIFDTSLGSIRVDSAASTLNLGSGTHLLLGSNSTTWRVLGGSIIAGTSTLKFDAINSVTFTGGSQVYNNVWFDMLGPSNVTVLGSNTFAEFRNTNSNAHSMFFEAGTTQTFGNFIASGASAGSRVTIDTAAGSTATHTLVKTGGGIVSCNFLDITQSVATPALTWYAGTDSINNQ